MEGQPLLLQKDRQLSKRQPRSRKLHHPQNLILLSLRRDQLFQTLLLQSKPNRLLLAQPNPPNQFSPNQCPLLTPTPNQQASLLVQGLQDQDLLLLQKFPNHQPLSQRLKTLHLLNQSNPFHLPQSAENALLHLRWPRNNLPHKNNLLLPKNNKR